MPQRGQGGEEALEHPGEQTPDEAERPGSTPQRIGEGLRLTSAAGGELVPEAPRPLGERPPDEDVHGHYHCHQGANGGHGAAQQTLLGGGAAEAAQARQQQAATDDLGRAQEVPAVGPGHHAVVDQLGDGGRQVQPHVLEPVADTVRLQGFAQELGDGGDRLVDAEGHVPGLAGEDQEDRGQLDARRPAVEEGDEEVHRGREEAQNGHRLQDVQDGQEQPLQAPGEAGGGAVDQSEGQRQQAGRQHPQERAEGVIRQHSRVHRNRGGGGVGDDVAAIRGVQERRQDQRKDGADGPGLSAAQHGHLLSPGDTGAGQNTITLTQEENRRLLVLGRVQEGVMTVAEAAETLGLSYRQT